MTDSMTTEPRASLVEEISAILLADPVCFGQVTADSVSALADIVEKYRLEALRTQGDGDRWRIAVWNACRDRGMSQDAALDLIRKAANDPKMLSASPTQASSREEGE